MAFRWWKFRRRTRSASPPHSPEPPSGVGESPRGWIAEPRRVRRRAEPARRRGPGGRSRRSDRRALPLPVHDLLERASRPKHGRQGAADAHDLSGPRILPFPRRPAPQLEAADRKGQDRKSTRLNSSHVEISYAVFCLKKKKKKIEAVLLTNILAS